MALTVSLSFAAVAAASAQASSAYVIEQRAANSTSRLILAPSGLRFDYYSPVRAGGRLRARRPKPLLGVIIRYRDARLFLLDPVRRVYQVLGLMSAISSYEAELKALQHAQPSLKLSGRPGSKPRSGQAPLTPPPTRLRRLALSIRIGPVRAQAYLLRQGALRERLWYANALPGPPPRIRSVLVQALGNSAAGPLDRALRAHAAQIPLRIDEFSARRWHTVLRTLSIRRRTLSPSTLQPPRGYRKAALVAPPKSKAHKASTPANPIRCGVLFITGALGCTSVLDELNPLVGPVSGHPAIWAFYWGSGFAAHSDYVAALNHGLENMVGDQFADPNSSAFYGPLGQYGVGRGRLLGSTVFPDNPPFDVGQQSISGLLEVEGFVFARRWVVDAPSYWWRWSDKDPIYAIFVDGSKVDSSNWGGYHAFTPTEGIFFSFLVHPALPWFIIKVPALDQISHQHDTPAWRDAVDTATERASHEFVEAATDPYPFTSWSDPLKEPIWEEGEIADICHQGGHSPWGTATRVVQYGSALAPYWSNNNATCVPDARPTAQIALPTNGATYPWDSSVEFHVDTNDLFDNGPVSDSGITWYDNGTQMAAGLNRSTFFTKSLTPGTHRIGIAVVDSQGGIRTAEVTINIVVQPPSVRITQPPNGSTFGSDQTINFVGEARDPQQGDLGPSATWSVDGTPVGTGASLFKYRISNQGAHTVTLSATNGAGATSSASITVNIGPPSGKPTVAITQPPDNTHLANGGPAQVTFSASASASGSATITGYSWNDDVDGSLGTGQTIMHTYPGSCDGEVAHHVTVTATDDLNQTATSTITVYVGTIC